MTENKYHNGKIYKICSDLGDKKYIGSTCNKLWSRFNHHKTMYKHWKAGKHNYTSSYDVFEAYGVENCKIILIDNVKCESKDELRREEDKQILAHECVNRRGAVLNQEKRDEYQNNYNVHYYQANKNVLRAKLDERLQCVCGGKFTRCHKAQHEKTKRHQKFLNCT